MELDDFLIQYADIIKDITIRDRAEIDTLRKYVKIIESLNYNPSDLEPISELLAKYNELIESETQALNDFVENIKTIDSISKEKEEIKDKIKVIVEKIQERSLEQSESQLNKK